MLVEIRIMAAIRVLHALVGNDSSHGCIGKATLAYVINVREKRQFCIVIYNIWITKANQVNTQQVGHQR